MTDSSQVEKMVRDTIGHLGKVDILVNNAGIVRKGWVKDLPEETWD